jgi:hypothetical protein
VQCATAAAMSTDTVDADAPRGTAACR